jgi:hypothetical protein
MRAEIRKYLQDHADTYTRQAVRSELLKAGYDETDVDAAIAEWESEGPARRAGPAGIGAQRSRFWLLAIGLHVAALVVAAIWIANSASATYSAVVVIVLGVVLLIGLGISGLIGRWLIPRSGLVVALVVPLVSALLLAGTCMAISGPLVTPPKTGTMQLHVEGARSFDGSGATVCHHSADGGFSVASESLGTVDGNTVRASVESFPGVTVASAAEGPGVQVSISLDSESNPEAREVYATIFSTQQTVELSADQLIGKVDFIGLARDLPQTGEPISGTISWDCK